MQSSPNKRYIIGGGIGAHKYNLLFLFFASLSRVQVLDLIASCNKYLCLLAFCNSSLLNLNCFAVLLAWTLDFLLRNNCLFNFLAEQIFWQSILSKLQVLTSGQWNMSIADVNYYKLMYYLPSDCKMTNWSNQHLNSLHSIRHFSNPTLQEFRRLAILMFHHFEKLYK